MTMSLILGVPALASLVMAVIMPRMKVDFDPVDDTDPVADPDPVADFDPAVKRISFRGALRQGLFRLLIGDLGRVYKTPELFRLCVLVFLMSVANWAFFGMFSFIFTEEVGGEELGLGLTLAASTAIATVVFAFAGRLIDRFGGRAGLFLSILLYIFVYSSISFATTPWLVILLFIVPVYPVFLVSATALAAEATRSEQRAGGVGVMSGVFSLSMAAGSVLGGLIGDHFGLRAIVVTSACLSCLCLVVFFLFVGFKRVRPAQEREGS
jgi:MFS family permease